MILFYLVIVIAVLSLIAKTLPDIDPNQQEDARSRYYSQANHCNGKGRA